MEPAPSLQKENTVTKRIQSQNLSRTGRHLSVVFTLALLLGIPVAGQSPFPQFPTSGNGKYTPHSADNSTSLGDSGSPDQKRLLSLNALRQKLLVSDTEKLVRLAKELNDEMAGADAATMTDAQLRKVAEIGKLAKSVREKMSYSTGAYPTPANPLNSGVGFQ